MQLWLHAVTVTCSHVIRAVRVACSYGYVQLGYVQLGYVQLGYVQSWLRAVRFTCSYGYVQERLRTVMLYVQLGLHVVVVTCSHGYVQSWLRAVRFTCSYGPIPTHLTNPLRSKHQELALKSLYPDARCHT
jgi:hypothetical protein